MIDCKNAEYLKLQKVSDETFAGEIHPLLATGEQILTSYQSVRDGVVFTTQRIILITVQGLSGKRADYTSLPYRRIQSFSTQRTVLEMDREIVLLVEGLGRIKLKFLASVDTQWLCRLLARYVL